MQPVEPEAPLVAPRGSRNHRRRFALIYGILGAVVLAGIAGVAVFAGRAINPAPTWSTWKPSGGGLGAAKQIAERISVGYHLPSGEQLVDVIAKEPSVSPSNTSIPIHYIAVRGSKGGGGDSISQISSSDSMMFSLCGLGASCAIEKGKPSVERGTLVRREILELALYTFKYVHGVKHVIAFMPPTPGNQPKYVIYLQKSDLESQLKQPLARTLAKKVPLPAAITRREQQAIDAVTEAKVYSFSLSQAQQGDAILVLAPLAA
ncbi:MAG: hypothetical protein QOF43_2122 [Gaiellaceae bacterium]|nr:hypothetical protein [Gaiellaceae bacterium]